MKQKSKSKSGNKTQKNDNQGGYSNKPNTIPTKSYGAKEHSYYEGNKVAHNSNENPWSRSRHSSVSDMWSDADEHFPALGASAASGPKVNVWEERKTKQEAIKALEPQNEYDEEAMFQHALALSLLEATEQEQQKKIEDDYMMQLEKLQFSSDAEVFDVPEEFTVEQATNFQTGISVDKQSQIEKYSKNPVSKSDQKDNTYSFEGSKFQGDLSVKKEHYTENYSDNSIVNDSRKDKSYNFVGARPKINKAIEAFGGWGLKDNKKRKNSEKITEFIDDVVSEKSNRYETFNDRKSKDKHTKENNYSDEKNVLPVADVKNTERSNEKDEILYDEEGTFLDYDDSKWKDSKNETNNQQYVSPNTTLDTWLNSKDDDDLNNEFINRNSTTTLNDTKLDNFISPPSYSEKPNIEHNDEIMSTSKEVYSSTVIADFQPKIIEDTESLSHKTSESINNIWPNAAKDQELSENKNDYKYNACSLNANSFTPFHEPTEVPTLTSCKIWSDKSSDDSSYFSSYSDNLTSKFESVKISNDIDNEVFNVASCDDSDDPPIPPPQPPTFASNINDCSASSSGISNSSNGMESPPVLQSQPLPGMQVPQFPTVVNPMFPFNPVLGCGMMDPLLIRRMLILTNPFLANQLIAMEEYYRSMGICVDLFSMSTPLPNTPAMLNPSLLQNPLANSVSGNIQQLQSEIQQLQTQIDASAESVSKNVFRNFEQESCKKSPDPSGTDTILDVSKSVGSLENGNEDPWYKSYLSNGDASIIPPPKPPSGEVNYNNLSVPQKYESSLIDSSCDKFAHLHASNNSDHLSNNVNKNRDFKPITTFEACNTKKDIGGWCDPEDDLADVQNLKSHTWDDGWGDPIAPPKPLRNPSLQEDRKKTVFRQPAKQPQIGRYQKNFSCS